MEGVVTGMAARPRGNALGARRFWSPGTPVSRGPGFACGSREIGAEVFGLCPGASDPSPALRPVPSRQPAIGVRPRGRPGPRNALQQAMRDWSPEIVLSSGSPVAGRRPIAPVETFQTNVMGTVHLLEACRQTPSVRVVINVTSDKCYENREWVWGYRENDALGGHDPYSSSKGCAELITAAYRRSYVR